MLPFHFGVVAALRDHGVKFEQASATSGGVMAALAILDAANLEVAYRGWGGGGAGHTYGHLRSPH